MKRSIHTTLLIVSMLMASAPAIGQNIYSKETWAARDKWQQVPKILEAMGLKKGDVIADIGSHQGYMTFKFSNHVGDQGKVFAVDVSSSQLRVLDGMLEENNIDNVETIRGDYDDPKLSKNSLDFVFIMDAYHEMDDHMDILRHAKSALKPEGKIVILEPIGEDRRDWNRSRQEGKHEIHIKYVVEDLKKAGFKIIRQEDPFIDRSAKKQDQMWFLLAQIDPSN